MHNQASNHIFEEWVDLYSDYLYSYALSKIGAVETTEDLIQDTFLAAIGSYKNFKSESSVKTWLTSMLKNKIADYYRKNLNNLNLDEFQLKSNMEIENKFFAFNQPGITWYADKIPSEWSINENENSNQYSEWLLSCLDLLPEKLKLIIQLKFLEEKSTAILCKEFNITSSNFFVLTYRAKLLLRNCIELKIKKSAL